MPPKQAVGTLDLAQTDAQQLTNRRGDPGGTAGGFIASYLEGAELGEVVQQLRTLCKKRPGPAEYLALSRLSILLAVDQAAEIADDASRELSLTRELNHVLEVLVQSACKYNSACTLCFAAGLACALVSGPDPDARLAACAQLRDAFPPAALLNCAWPLCGPEINVCQLAPWPLDGPFLLVDETSCIKMCLRMYRVHMETLERAMRHELQAKGGATPRIEGTESLPVHLHLALDPEFLPKKERLAFVDRLDEMLMARSPLFLANTEPASEALEVGGASAEKGADWHRVQLLCHQKTEKNKQQALAAASTRAQRAKVVKKNAKKKGGKQAAPAHPAQRSEKAEAGQGKDEAAAKAPPDAEEASPAGEDAVALMQACIEAQMAEEERLAATVAAKRSRQVEQQAAPEEEAAKALPAEPAPDPPFAADAPAAQPPSAPPTSAEPPSGAAATPGEVGAPRSMSPVQATPAASPGTDNDEELWQSAPRKGRSKVGKGVKEQGAQPVAVPSSAAAAPATLAIPRQPHKQQTPACAFVSWDGHWKCGTCGLTYSLEQGCVAKGTPGKGGGGCGRYPAPCPDWCFGACADPDCERPHLAFDMRMLRKKLHERDAARAQGRRVATPHQGHLRHGSDCGGGGGGVASTQGKAVAVGREAAEPRRRPVLPPRARPAARAAEALAGSERASPAPLRAPAVHGPAPAAGKPGGAPTWVQLTAPKSPPPPAWAPAAAAVPSAAAPIAFGAPPPGDAVLYGDAADDSMSMLLQQLGVSESTPQPAAAQFVGGWLQSGAAPPPLPLPLPPLPLGEVWPSPGEDQESAELAAAVEASLQEQPGAGQAWLSPAGLPHPLCQPAHTAGGAGDGALAIPGLVNATGEYNCFLNVVVQCLWHCGEFRAAVVAWPRELYGADAVVAALRNLFVALAGQEQQHLAGSGARRGVVDPSELREALSALPGARFQLGEMNDAGELLLTIFSCMHEAAPAAAFAVEATFGLHVRESVSCDACGLETHQSEYVQYFHNASATALRAMRTIYGGGLRTDQLLRRIEEQTLKSCDTDRGGCGSRHPVRHALTAPPAVFTLQLAWETTREPPQDIGSTLLAVDETVWLQDTYAGVDPAAPPYCLRSMVAYYGSHYSAFVLRPELGAWFMFDDASVSMVGGWGEVVCKCQAGRVQPSVLFYVAR